MKLAKGLCIQHQQFSSRLNLFQAMSQLLLRSPTWTGESQQLTSSKLHQSYIQHFLPLMRPLACQWNWWKFQQLGLPRIEEQTLLSFIYFFATFVYTFATIFLTATTNIAFLQCTEHFLPPDPEMIPQHLLFIFDAYKRQNILDACKPNEADVLAFGYFSSEDISTCILLSKTTDKYEILKPTV